jgi:hypothetical protein
MKYFASKKEAWVTGAIAAFFVLVAIGFTFEPLATVIIKSRDLPNGTILSARIPENIGNDELIKDGETLLAAQGIQVPEGEALIKDANAILSAVNGVRILSIITQSAGILPVTLSLSGATDEAYAAKPLVKLIAAYTKPSENMVTMPDNTTFIEFVADPDKADPTKLLIPLSINSQGQTSTISTSNKPLDKANYYLSPMSCTQLPDGVKILNFAKIRDSFLGNIIFSLKQYLANFSCFQNFSTFD